MRPKGFAHEKCVHPQTPHTPEGQALGVECMHPYTPHIPEGCPSPFSTAYSSSFFCDLLMRLLILNHLFPFFSAPSLVCSQILSCLCMRRIRGRFVGDQILFATSGSGPLAGESQSVIGGAGWPLHRSIPPLAGEAQSSPAGGVSGRSPASAAALILAEFLQLPSIVD